MIQEYLEQEPAEQLRYHNTSNGEPTFPKLIIQPISKHLGI